MPELFKDFFQAATGQGPYPYQERFAETTELPHLLRAPTGAGKTATAIIGWLWRWHSQQSTTPRRLVYCLPMRVLVEQSAREAKKWTEALHGQGKLADKIPVHILLGGVDPVEWYLYPEQPTILIGTQDMLLSRALNRGYAANRFHWPIDFGLLNNDCLWIFDEPQLMASGVSTSAQLAGLRQSFSTFATCPSVWMSATLEPSWLDTIDFRGRFPAPPLELDNSDYDPSLPLHKRMTATKAIEPLGATSSKDMKNVAKKVLEKHIDGTQTLVVLNTVDRAKAVFDAINKSTRGAAKLLLVHSRFRPAERRLLNDALQQKGDETKNRIIIATQVVEAGVDISARTLITELAPWSSIVQRIGRCNRTGDDSPGLVFWIDLEEKQYLPYSAEDLEFARSHLTQLAGKGVSPKELDDYKTTANIQLPFEHKHVLRRRDLLDLFDTAPDLSGNDIDIQRFVRSDDEETDVQVFWRAIDKSGPAAEEAAGSRDELCSVPIGQAKTFLATLAEKKRGAGYIWDHLDEEWIRLDPKRIRPSLTILLSSSVGGYDWDPESRTGTGWKADSTDEVPPVRVDLKPEEAAKSDLNSSLGGKALKIQEHTDNVCREMDRLIADLLWKGAPCEEALRSAARWHDVGKAHNAFQIGMRGANDQLTASELWAKSGTRTRLRHGRNHFRHELASALAVLQQDAPFLVAYLSGAHHGRVRISIRALPDEPDEKAPLPNPDTLFALGVYDGDLLPAVELGGGQRWSGSKLDLRPMHLGGDRSWTANALKLLGELGPFKLAYLEALLRAADVRASKKEASDA